MALAYKVLDYPRLGMRLELGAVYAKAELEARCGRRDPKRRRLLHKKLEDRSLFRPVSIKLALQKVKKTITKAEQPKWVKPPAIRRDADQKDEVGRMRLVADGIAASMLDAADEGGHAISGESVLTVLRAWGFYLNKLRTNVVPEGREGVFSDTLGLTCNRRQCITVSALSRKYKNVTRLLMRWFAENRPRNLDEDFPVTSISVNSAYAARRHRDKNNAGPSVIAAFGSFVGGHLRYWPGDSGKGPVSELTQTDSELLRVRHAPALFDGRRAHEVTPFRGDERFSLVFFTVGKYWKASAQCQRAASSLGFQMPSKPSLARANTLVGVRPPHENLQRPPSNSGKLRRMMLKRRRLKRSSTKMPQTLKPLKIATQLG
jgi:hypothetical protein